MSGYYLTRNSRGKREFRPLSEIVDGGGLGYFAVFSTSGRLRLVYGDPTAPGSGAIRLLPGKAGVTTEPLPVINWKSAPAVGGSASTDWVLPPGNYINEDPTRAMFGSKYGTGRIIIDGSRIKSAGPVVGGFRGKITLLNSVLEVIRSTTVGRPSPRLISVDEIKDFVMEGCTVPFIGQGIYLTGTGNPKQFAGDAAAGDGVRMRRNIIRNVDGSIYGRKSNWTPTKNGNSFTQSGAQYGAVVANFVQLNGMPACNMLVDWNEVLSELGCWAEDMISMFGGSGGRPVNPAIFSDNLLHNTGARDWNYVPGVSPTYDASQQITLNADPGNTSNWMGSTAYSGTSHLIGDGHRADAYLLNSCYVVMRRTIAFGYRPLLSIQGGHHDTIDGCELYATDRHFDGTPYARGAWQAYQITDYHKGSTAADTGQLIWGYHTMKDSRIYQGSSSGVMNPVGSVLDNNGTFTNNTVRPAVSDGGRGAITAYRQRAAVAGVTLGSALELERPLAF